jgi:anti-anti-sigma regulatory factor
MRPAAAEAVAGFSGVTPAHVFGATLDARSGPALAQWRAQAGDAAVLRLDFSRITACDDAGCAILLEHVQALVKAKRELIVVAADELEKLLRSCVCVGRKEDGAATWLLLLEVLQLLNREKEFEETSMDYCITFEVSPPSFTPPYKVETAARQRVAAQSDRFMLPPVIEGQTAPLLAAISAYAEQYSALVFDCTHLARMEFAAAGQLLAHLQGLATDQRRVEFREVNHLVAALMRLLGYTGLGRIFAHKY